MSDHRRAAGPPPVSLRGHATLQSLLGRATGRRPVVVFESPPRVTPTDAAPPAGDAACPLCRRAVSPASALRTHVAACADADDVRRACRAGVQLTLSSALGRKRDRAPSPVDAPPPVAPPPLGPRTFDTACVARRLAHAVDAPPGTDAA